MGWRRRGICWLLGCGESLVVGLTKRKSRIGSGVERASCRGTRGKVASTWVFLILVGGRRVCDLHLEVVGKESESVSHSEDTNSDHSYIRDIFLNEGQLLLPYTISIRRCRTRRSASPRCLVPSKNTPNSSVCLLT